MLHHYTGTGGKFGNIIVAVNKKSVAKKKTIACRLPSHLF